MKIRKVHNKLLKITPDINIDNSKVLGLLENIYCYRNLLRRIKKNKTEIAIESQFMLTYEILMTKDNTSFYLGYPKELQDNIETELNICWKNATFKKVRFIPAPDNEKRELELNDHYFLSLKTDKRGEYPLSNILETQNILRDNERILVRLEMIPMNPTWYREIEEHIKNFDKGL